MNKTFDNNFKKGCLTALGIPGISLAMSFIALGALFKNSGLNATQSFLSTLIGFALPGQLVMAGNLADQSDRKLADAGARLDSWMFHPNGS